MSSRDGDLLRYIWESIARVEVYTQDGRESFLSQGVLQDAVMRRLETLTDTAGHPSDALKARHPTIPWRDITGFRNVSAHGYLELDMTRVWNTVKFHLPPLKAVVERELRRATDP